MYGYLTRDSANGYLYAKVYRYNGGSPVLLFQTVNDDEDVNVFTSSHMFTWTYTAPSATVPSGDRIYTEIWLDVTAANAGGTVQAISNPTFDTDSTGWVATDGGSATSAYDAATGNPAGSIYATVSGARSGGLSGTVAWETTFTYDLGVPASSSLSFDRDVTAYSAYLNNQYTIYLISPSGTTNTIYPTTTYSAADTAWVSVTDYSVDPSYFSESGTYTLQIYADISAGRSATTTIYFDNVYLDIVNPPAQFILQYDDQSTDSNVMPTLSASSTPTFDIPVSVGWNLISYPVLASGDIETVLNDDVVWDSAQWYNPLDTGDHWKTHVIGRTLNDLSTIDNTMAVWLHVTNAGDGFLTVSGNAPTSTVITLNAGWNLVSYPASASAIMDSVLPGSVTKVAQYNGTATYLVSEVDTSVTSFVPGNGYWLYSTADTTWTVTY